MGIQRSSYKDVEAVTLENGELRVKLLPDWGAKTASLLHKATGCELLWQNPEPGYRKTSYGAPYSDGEFSGFDEMFPTISRCFYEDPPWAGVEMPDHGEVWSVPWSYAQAAGRSVFRVEGVRFPYSLEKSVWLEGAALRSLYRLTNRSQFPFHFIWAAHPLFRAVPGMRFVVPAGMTQIVNSVPGPVLGGYGARHAFPRTTDLDLSTASPPDGRSYQKYFFLGKMREGWCRLENPEADLAVTIRFSPDRVPYLGMWFNQGGWAGQYNIAPEPCTAAMDRVDLSRLWQAGSCIGPLETWEWELGLEVGSGGGSRQ
jgi:galactose mutarotase-like enzyme